MKDHINFLSRHYWWKVNIWINLGVYLGGGGLSFKLKQLENDFFVRKPIKEGPIKKLFWIFHGWNNWWKRENAQLQQCWPIETRDLLLHRHWINIELTLVIFTVEYTILSYRGLSHLKENYFLNRKLKIWWSPSLEHTLFSFTEDHKWYWSNPLVDGCGPQ